MLGFSTRVPELTDASVLPESCGQNEVLVHISGKSDRRASNFPPWMKPIKVGYFILEPTTLSPEQESN